MTAYHGPLSHSSRPLKMIRPSRSPTSAADSNFLGSSFHTPLRKQALSAIEPRPVHRRRIRGAFLHPRPMNPILSDLDEHLGYDEDLGACENDEFPVVHRVRPQNVPFFKSLDNDEDLDDDNNVLMDVPIEEALSISTKNLCLLEKEEIQKFGVTPRDQLNGILSPIATKKNMERNRRNLFCSTESCFVTPLSSNGTSVSYFASQKSAFSPLPL